MEAFQKVEDRFKALQQKHGEEREALRKKHEQELNNVLREALLQRVISGHDISEQDISEHDISEQDISGLDISGHDISEHDISGQYISGKDISEQDISEQDICDISGSSPEVGDYVACVPGTNLYMKIKFKNFYRVQPHVAPRVAPG
jgi:uncharacterized protein YjbI with pentapeptide repeats